MDSVTVNLGENPTAEPKVVPNGRVRGFTQVEWRVASVIPPMYATG